MPDAGSECVRLTESFQPRTTHFIDGDAEAQRIKSTRLMSYSCEEGWSGFELGQWAPALPFCVHGLLGGTVLGALEQRVNLGEVCKLGESGHAFCHPTPKGLF